MPAGRLTAQRLDAPPAGSGRTYRAPAASALLHLAILTAIIGLPHVPPVPPDVAAQVELIEDPDTARDGAPGAATASETTSSADPAAAPAVLSPAPPPPVPDAVPVPPPSQPVAQATPLPTATQGAPAALAKTLGTDSNATVSADPGGPIISAGPDAKHPNAGPDYPLDAARRGEHGRVFLRMYIDETGHVTRTEILQSSGSPRLDRAARAALAKWVFRPARKAGRPAASTLDQYVNFEL